LGEFISAGQLRKWKKVANSADLDNPWGIAASAGTKIGISFGQIQKTRLVYYLSLTQR